MAEDPTASLASMQADADSNASQPSTTPAPSPPQETEGTPQETTEPQEQEAPEVAEGEGTEGDGEDPREFMKSFDEEFGLKQSDKYADDDAFMKGMAELIRASGRRDEDAGLGKQLRERFTGQEQQLTDLLAGKTLPAEPASKAAEAGDDPLSTWNPAWVTENEKGQPVAAYGAPKDVAERHQRYTAALQQRYHEIATNPEKFIAPLVAKETQELRQQLEDANTQRVEQEKRTAMQNICEKNRNLLYVNGDPDAGMTPRGERALALWEKDEQLLEDHPDDDARRWRAAVRLVTPEQGKAPTTRKPPRRAVHKPAVAAAGAGKPITAKQMFADGKSLEEVATFFNQQEDAKAGAMG